MAPVPAANGPGRDRRADHGRPSRTARVARTARGRLQRAARRPAVPAVSAPRLRARGLAVAVPRRLVAPLAGALAGRRDRGGTSRDRRPLLRCDERADRVRRTGDWLAGGAALRVQTVWGGAGDRAGRNPLTATTPSHTNNASTRTCVRAKGGSDWVGASRNSTGIRLNSCATRDRKSTRLNSSHGYISYAVFCLKKKKKNNDEGHQTL